MIGYCRIVALLMGLAFAGCVSTRTVTGRNFSTDALRGFKIGQTTKSDVSATMGEPDVRTNEEGGNEHWMYRYSDDSATIVGSQSTFTQASKLATFIFNGDQLTDLYWDELSVYDKANPGSITGGRNISDEDLSSLKIGTTREEEVLSKFGTPTTRRCHLDGKEMWVYEYVADGRAGGVILNFEDGVLARRGNRGGGSGNRRGD